MSQNVPAEKKTKVHAVNKANVNCNL